MNKFTMSGLAVLCLTLAACGGSGYDREEFIDDLVEEGLDRETATCIVDGVEAEIPEDRLDDRGEPTEEEEAIIIDVTTECVLGG